MGSAKSKTTSRLDVWHCCMKNGLCVNNLRMSELIKIACAAVCSVLRLTQLAQAWWNSCEFFEYKNRCSKVMKGNSELNEMEDPSSTFCNISPFKWEESSAQQQLTALD
ncbi:hypothetical protein WA026_010342 [Henosepilachna vigintioctopunctata]|uniref:Uncharacterized protein n=1 Tax=Henosepilachna vigintioctopunctata TaxID=420089 RepID=A0AAW1VAT9_9CUCU